VLLLEDFHCILGLFKEILVVKVAFTILASFEQNPGLSASVDEYLEHHN